MPKKKIFILTYCIIILSLLFIPFIYASGPVLSGSAPWKEFKKAYGENWDVKWNEKTGTPHRVFGNKKPVQVKGKNLKKARGAGSLSENEFENIARIFIDQNNGLFRINNKDLELLRSKKHGSKSYVTFKQLFKNIPVYNSRVDFRFDAEGNILLFGADVHPEINIPVLQKISADDAVKIAKNDIKFNQERDSIIKQELFIYPEEMKEGFKYHLVWRLEADITEPKGDWVYFIDAVNGEIRLKYNDLKNNIAGKITGYILPYYENDEPQEVSFPFEDIYAGSYGGTSDENGNYLIETPPGSYVMTAGLSGKYLKVINGKGLNAFISKNADDGEIKKIVWYTNFASDQYDEINVYYHAMKMHCYMKDIDPEFTGMDYCVPATVGLTGSYRNSASWSNTNGMSFGAGTPGYSGSLALYADVIYHEYSHGVNNKLYIMESGKALDYIDGTESGAMEEGFADYWACTVTGEPLIGEGIFEDVIYLRDLHNNLKYPYDWSDEVHSDGRIISGAMWKMRELLGKDTADRLFHFARYGLPTTFEDFFLEVLMNDDDNNNLRDGTPNSKQIYSSFGSRNISGMNIKEVSVDDKEGGNDNGKMNKGERINLVVALENKMFEDAEDVQAVLSTEDYYVDIISGQADYGNINKGANAGGFFTVLLDGSAPVDYLIPFDLKVNSKKGYTFDLSFSVRVSDSLEKRWRIENITSVPDPIDYSGSSVLERDKNGNFYLLFGYNSLSYAFYNGDKWEISVLDSTSLYPYNYSLRLINNIPYLVFNYTDVNGSYLKYAKFSNGLLETEIVDSNSLRYNYPSLIFDSGNYPYISYALNDFILFACHNEGSWKTEKVDTVDYGSNNSIGIDKNNFIMVSYYDSVFKRLKFAERVTSYWENGFLDISVDMGKYTCLRVGNNGYPHIVYYDNDKGNLKYIFWDGRSWIKEIIDMAGNVGLYPSLAIDWNNRPHVVYYDKTNGRLKYAYNNGNFWEINTIDDSGDAGYYPSLVLDENGLPNVAYYTKSSDGNTYLKFASNNVMAPIIYLYPEDNGLTGSNVKLRWDIKNLPDGDLLSYDIYLDTAGAMTKIAENISEPSYVVAGLKYNEVYYWKLVYRNKNRFEYKGPVYKFRTAMAGDLDKNRIIDGNDLVFFSRPFGSTKDFKLYESISDIDQNGRVDGADLMFLGMNFGKSY